MSKQYPTLAWTPWGPSKCGACEDPANPVAIPVGHSGNDSRRLVPTRAPDPDQPFDVVFPCPHCGADAVFEHGADDAGGWADYPLSFRLAGALMASDVVKASGWTFYAEQTGGMCCNVTGYSDPSTPLTIAFGMDWEQGYFAPVNEGWLMPTNEYGEGDYDETIRVFRGTISEMVAAVEVFLQRTAIVNRVEATCAGAAGMPHIDSESTREDLIAWLCWCDGNGVWTDEDTVAEGGDPMTLDEAWESVALMADDSEEV